MLVLLLVITFWPFQLVSAIALQLPVPLPSSSISPLLRFWLSFELLLSLELMLASKLQPALTPMLVLKLAS